MAVAMARRTVKCPHSRQQEGRTSESGAVDWSRRPDDGTPESSGPRRGPIEGEKVDERALVAIAVRAGWTDQRSRSREKTRQRPRALRRSSPVASRSSLWLLYPRRRANKHVSCLVRYVGYIFAAVHSHCDN